MLTVRVCFLSIKYNIMKEMVNRVTFLTNVCFMMLNNAAFLIQWSILFHLREDIGGYTMSEVMLLWGLIASCCGVSRILFARVYTMHELIVNGKLDAYLVLPKNVLLSVMTSKTESSAIGDLLYGILIMCVFCFSVKRFLLFLWFTMTGALILTAFALLVGSMSFWFVQTEMFGAHMINVVISFATYPDGIFQGAARFLLYFVIPVGMTVYHPVHIMVDFDAAMLLAVTGYMLLLGALAVFVFYRGLRRYSSGSLMEGRG